MSNISFKSFIYATLTFVMCIYIASFCFWLDTGDIVLPVTQISDLILGVFYIPMLYFCIYRLFEINDSYNYY